MYWIKRNRLNGVQEALTGAEVIAASLKVAPHPKDVADSLPFGSKDLGKASAVRDFFAGADPHNGYAVVSV
jgi:hypothetical protein